MMMKRPSDNNPWSLSPEAKEKVREQVKEWGQLNQYEQTFNLASDQEPKAQLDRYGGGVGVKLGVTEHPSRKPKLREEPRYMGDKRGGEQEKLKQYQIPLDEYLQDLSEFKIIKDVYVLNDEREDEGIISVLIKLIPLMSIDARVFDTENQKVTNYLKATGILDAREIHVSFQYTEVF